MEQRILPQGNERLKWNKAFRQLEVNDLVWIVDENLRMDLSRQLECWNSIMEAMGE